jgi:hypothetical protein
MRLSGTIADGRKSDQGLNVKKNLRIKINTVSLVLEYVIGVLAVFSACL